MRNEKIESAIHEFANLANINDDKFCDELIDNLSNMNINDAIDTILVSLNSLLNRKILSMEDILQNIDSILLLNPEKYKTAEDLIKRISWIKSMNMEHAEMPLEENHKLVLETFDKFNTLIQTDFDCYYTGGIMVYLAADHKLERYHTDLDLFINENELEALYDLVSKSEDFEFKSNMDNKEVHGHEYTITYKGTPMSIGLFLFERTPDEEIVLKEYYYDNKNENNGLFVDEHHLTKNYANMTFSDEIRSHNGASYKMNSLEAIYNKKKDSRPKDKYDASIIKDRVNLSIDNKLDTENKNNYDILHKPTFNSVIQRMEKKLNKPVKDDKLYI